MKIEYSLDKPCNVVGFKKLVILIGTKKAVEIAVHNDKHQKRYTGLKERLKKNVIKSDH